jgi:hypothetical protein
MTYLAFDSILFQPVFAFDIKFDIKATKSHSKRFRAVRASAICGSLAKEFSKWLRNSW